MNERIIVAGSGGQGVMSLGSILTEGGMLSHLNVTHFPSYGAEMRGGTSNCSVCISSEAVASPVVSIATTLIILNAPSLNKFINSITDDGALIYNSSLVTEIPTTQCKTFAVPANDLAIELGNIQGANMIMMGVFLAQKGRDMEIKNIEKAINNRFKYKDQKVSDFNIKCLNTGLNIKY